MSLVIGVTGGIGSGKSAVTRCFEALGIAVVDADVAARVVVEPDEDRWHAYRPDLQDLGAATWGHTRREELKHIHEVVEIILEELIEDGKPVPRSVKISSDPLISVMV